MTNPIRRRTAKRRVARELDGPQRRLLSRVDVAVSLEDSMWLSGRERYFRVGVDALRCIDAACAANGNRSPARILDMPSGWGRVLRFIVLRFPDASVTACDIVEDGTRYCAKRFGARSVVSSPDLEGLEFPGTFDLIWCGSLVTHLGAESIDAVLRLYRRSVSPEGIAVVTTHGEEVARRLAVDPGFYGISAEQRDVLLSDYERDGFGFVEYADAHEPQLAGYEPSDAPWGVTLSSREWIRSAAERAGLRELHYAPQEWNGHQDVFAFQAAS